MAEILILAHSWREGGRCIAGIDINTDEWIRPVTVSNTSGLTRNMILVNGEEPDLLDVVDIPINGMGRDLGCQPENRTFGDDEWEYIETWDVQDARDYLESNNVILHDHAEWINLSDFTNIIPRNRWKSLQFIESHVDFRRDTRDKWRARLYDGARHFLSLSVTDVRMRERLEQNGPIEGDFLITVSLGGPFLNPPRCFKLVAGVIDI